MSECDGVMDVDGVRPSGEKRSFHFSNNKCDIDTAGVGKTSDEGQTTNERATRCMEGKQKIVVFSITYRWRAKQLLLHRMNTIFFLEHVFPK